MLGWRRGGGGRILLQELGRLLAGGSVAGSMAVSDRRGGEGRKGGYLVNEVIEGDDWPREV